MYQIKVKVNFRAAHRLPPPYEGKCNNVHGEGYTAIFVFQTRDLNDYGMVADFGVIKKQLKTWIDKNMDHGYIYQKNDRLGKLIQKEGMKVYEMKVAPTAENIAFELFKIFRDTDESCILKKVGIVESWEDSVAWYINE